MKSFWLCCATLALLAVSHPADASSAASTPTAAPAAAAPAAAAPVDPLNPVPDTPASAGSKPDWMKYENPYVGEQNDLSNPNRTPDEIVAWVQGHATDMLTFTASDTISLMQQDGAPKETIPEEANTKLTRIKKYFTPQGWTEYAGYMTTGSGLIDMVRKQSRSVTTIVNGTGTVIEKGPAGPNYHWLVQSPVMISIVGLDMDGEQKTLMSGDYSLEVQVGRVAEGGDENGLAIEGWKVKAKDTAPPP